MLLNYIIRSTGDEIWGSFMNADTKDETKQWINTHSQTESLNKNHLPARKLMLFSVTGN
jgi:hypothetical protein